MFAEARRSRRSGHRLSVEHYRRAYRGRGPARRATGGQIDPHRARNDLQILSSLFTLRADSISPDESAREAVLESKDQAEAEYRYALTRVRENGEGIALLNGDAEERRGIDTSPATLTAFSAKLRGVARPRRVK